MVSEIQSVVFLKNYGWNKKLAGSWLLKHHLVPLKPPDEKFKSQLRYRITNPFNYFRFVTKKTLGGINFIIGIK